MPGFSEAASCPDDEDDTIAGGQAHRPTLNENLQKQLLETDDHDVPQSVLDSLRLAVPEASRTWGTLRAWVADNNRHMLPIALDLPGQLRTYHLEYRHTKVPHRGAEAAVYSVEKGSVRAPERDSSGCFG